MKITAYTIVAKDGEIGSGQRGQKYIFWYESEAQEYIDEQEAVWKRLWDKPGAPRRPLGWIIKRIEYEL